MSDIGLAYEFAFRGLLAEEALNRAGRRPRFGTGMLDVDIAQQLSLDVLDDEHVHAAKQMSAVYVAIAAFEMSVREMVTTILREAAGDDWWESCVSSPIQQQCAKRKEDEAKHKFHTQRGEAPISYTDLKQLGNIIRANWPHFEDYLPSAEWATAIFDAIERPRNVIMHSGTLSPPDIARIGTNLRDWIVQVGA